MVRLLVRLVFTMVMFMSLSSLTSIVHAQGFYEHQSNQTGGWLPDKTLLAMSNSSLLAMVDQTHLVVPNAYRAAPAHPALSNNSLCEHEENSCGASLNIPLTLMDGTEPGASSLDLEAAHGSSARTTPGFDLGIDGRAVRMGSILYSLDLSYEQWESTLAESHRV